jgi:hypothetical protein
MGDSAGQIQPLSLGDDVHGYGAHVREGVLAALQEHGSLAAEQIAAFLASDLSLGREIGVAVAS